MNKRIGGKCSTNGCLQPAGHTNKCDAEGEGYYETTRLYTAQQYDRQTVDLKEANHHWQKCEEGWNKSIKQAEGFLRERDEALEIIKSLTGWLDAKCTIDGCWKTKYEKLLMEKGVNDARSITNITERRV